MIDPATGIVHGILVSGPDDFETSSDSTGTCLIHRECPGVVCNGPVGAQAANAVDISLVAAFVPAIPAVEVRGDINDNGTDDAFVVRRGSLTYEATIELDGSAVVTFDTLIPVGTPLELDGSLDVVLEDLTLDGIDDLMVRVGPTRLFVAGRSGLSLPNVSSSWSGLSELAARLPASLLSMTALDATSLQSTGTLKRPIVRLSSSGSHVTMHGASTGLAPTFAIPSECGRTGPNLAPDGSVHTSSRAVAFVPASDSGVGMAALLVDCPGDAGTTNALVALSPIDGRELGTLSLDHREAWGSFSYRSVERDLLAIQQTSARAVSVYSIGLAGSDRGHTRLLFSTTRPTNVRAFGWDARTREVVMVEQGTSRTSTSLDVVRLSETGDFRSSTTRTSPCPSNARIVGAHVVDGTVLGACAQTSGFGSRETIGRLVRLDGAGSTVATLSDFVGDMTCDTSTFPGQSVVWGIGIGGAELNAIHVPASACQASSFTGIRPIRPILPRTLTTRF
ncbi:MAG: hypothetical protein H6721_17420 [Sandaracinus sp.]|nr:hypothetical protein [Sandaracinus sp.]